MKGKVQVKRYGRPGQKGRSGKQRDLDFALWEEETRKDTTRATFGANFLALQWRAEEGKGTGRGKRLVSETIRKVESSGLITWTTHKYPPWTGGTIDIEKPGAQTWRIWVRGVAFRASGLLHTIDSGCDC